MPRGVCETRPEGVGVRPLIPRSWGRQPHQRDRFLGVETVNAPRLIRTVRGHQPARKPGALPQTRKELASNSNPRPQPGNLSDVRSYLTRPIRAQWGGRRGGRVAKSPEKDGTMIGGWGIGGIHSRSWDGVHAAGLVALCFGGNNSRWIRGSRLAS